MADGDDDAMSENDGKTTEEAGSAAGATQDDGADNMQGEGDDASQDVNDDTIEPLPGLPSDDYGRRFDAPPPWAPMEVAQQVCRLFRTDGVPTLVSWRGGFMRWDTTHWVEVEAKQMRSHLYRSLSRATYEHATAAGAETRNWNPDRRKVGNVMEAVGARAHVTSDIDPPSWFPGSVAETEASQMVSCANGLLDLRRRALVDHTPLLFNLVSVPFDYNPNAPRPAAWLEFLGSLWHDDPDSIMLLQEFFGYLLSGRTDMHKMLALIGPMRAGKGTIARALTTLVGKANVAGPTLSGLGTNFGLSPLLGKPVAVISDARLGSGPSHTVVERLLSITGEDTLTVDRKYREPWTGRLPTRFVMLSNELPRFMDSSGAIATRMLILQLTKSFLDREDRTIETRLVHDMPGILNWALDGLDRLIANGRFTVPRSAEAAATMMMDLASPVSAFVREMCELGPDRLVDKDSLYFSWKMWADANGHHAGAKITFGRSLHAAVPGLGRADISVGGKRVHGYRGISLIGASDPRENNSDHPAHPARRRDPQAQDGSDHPNRSAQTASVSSSARGPVPTPQDGARVDAEHSLSSGAIAQDAQDETHCRPNNGHRGPLPLVASTQEPVDEESTRKSGPPDFASLERRLVRRHVGTDLATPGANTASAANEASAPVRINGRPIDRSSHYMAASKGSKRRRR